MDLLEAAMWVALGFFTTLAGLEVAWREVGLRKKEQEAALV
ncbi:hypothetical protein [Nitrososphaera viennensis]|uniref:Uncharacterized protein n=2 Tax=Nitrososphaera viennensis TaxID=1034015 RepID=A0A060HRY2_9ARCH|nr:hypothetical protein [Nitrososphaera viennensis]AIC16281.1 hypothetical protein NVIE_020240 [Nitrososphaera viennensis EN76]UVS68219.1 hypothetical protein NWT39_09945 [Nitrososphaera viennensis]